MIRRLSLATLALSFALTLTAPLAIAQVGPPTGMIYANDMSYRTVGTPANLPNHGPFDTLYFLGDDLAPVSESAPGDQDYNGGRWEVRPVTFLTIEPTQFTNADQVEAAAASGQISIGEVALRFVCPLVRQR